MLTHLTSTLRAPKGVTKIAGAKPYAAKLAASPTATIKMRFYNNMLISNHSNSLVMSPAHHIHSFR